MSEVVLCSRAVLVKSREAVLTDIAQLGRCLGCELRPVADSVRESNDSVAIRALGSLPLGPALSLDLVAEVYTYADWAPEDEGPWAILFVFMNRVRVAPPGCDYLVAVHREGCWSLKGWEPDAFDEWSELRELPV